jgi:hypothetical protein
MAPLSSLSQTSQAFPQLKQSYENLVALANAREVLHQTRREAIRHGKQVRKMVWRDRGEPPVELRSVEDCIEHAVRGGSRKYPLFWYSIMLSSTHSIVPRSSGCLMGNLASGLAPWGRTGRSPRNLHSTDLEHRLAMDHPLHLLGCVYSPRLRTSPPCPRMKWPSFKVTLKFTSRDLDCEPSRRLTERRALTRSHGERC